MVPKFLPTRLRVRVASLRNDARSVARALRESRYRGSRVTVGVTERSEPPTRATPATPTAPPRHAEETEAEAAAVVHFADAGIEIVVEPGQSILDAGLANGVDLLFSCTVGGCGACMLQIVEGEVEYEDPDAICLTEDEIADGCCLACVGRPRGRVVVEA